MEIAQMNKFQFYLSSIKSNKGQMEIAQMNKFQFYLSSIKRSDL